MTPTTFCVSVCSVKKPHRGSLKWCWIRALRTLHQRVFAASQTDLVVLRAIAIAIFVDPHAVLLFWWTRGNVSAVRLARVLFSLALGADTLLHAFHDVAALC